jgi:hypothetical protein
MQATNGSMTGTKRTKANFPNKEKDKNRPTDEQRYPFRGQGQPQPQQGRRRILGVMMRQAQPDSRA